MTKIKNQFAKIFDVNEHQVLITKQFDQDVELDVIRFETRIDGLSLSMDIEGFKDDEDAKEAFEGINYTSAHNFYIRMKRLITNT